MLIGGWDTETTGNQVDKDRIIELAMIVMDLDTWTERVRYVRRFNPQMRIEKKAFAAHGIAEADLMHEPLFQTAAPLITTLFNKVDLFVGHNIAGFDFPILAHELARCGCGLKRDPEIIDTMLDTRWATPDGKQPSLGELCWSLDVPYDPTKAHAADYDVEVNLQAFKRGLDLGYFKIPQAAQIKKAA